MAGGLTFDELAATRSSAAWIVHEQGALLVPAMFDDDLLAALRDL